MKKTESINKFKIKFGKFKKHSDDLYWHFKEMRSKLKSLSKEASKLANDVEAFEACPVEMMSMLIDYSTFIGESTEDIYATLFNMKNSTLKKPLPKSKRKKICYERTRR